MAKKPNYDFEKRKKEQDRKRKKEQKREDRLQRKRDDIADTLESAESTEPATSGEVTD